MAKNVLPKHWNGSEFEELHIVTKASNVFTNDNKSVQQKIDDFTSHLADYATEIANRVKKDGDELTGIYLAGLKYMNVFSQTINVDSNVGYKIKTNIPYQNNSMITLFLHGRLQALASPLFLSISVWNRVTSILSAGYSSINSISPEIKVASENGLLVFHINALNLQFSQLCIDVIATGASISNMEGWTVVAEGISADAVDIVTIPLKE